MIFPFLEYIDAAPALALGLWAYFHHSSLLYTYNSNYPGSRNCIANYLGPGGLENDFSDEDNLNHHSFNRYCTGGVVNYYNQEQYKSGTGSPYSTINTLYEPIHEFTMYSKSYSELILSLQLENGKLIDIRNVAWIVINADFSAQSEFTDQNTRRLLTMYSKSYSYSLQLENGEWIDVRNVALN